MQRRNHLPSRISESCNSIIRSDGRGSFFVSRTASDEKRAGKKISKVTRSPLSSADLPAKDAMARRSTISNLQSGSLMRNRKVASPLLDKTWQSSREAEESIPPILNTASIDSNVNSSLVSSSTHFFNIKSVVPESIILSPEVEERIHKQSQKTARRLLRQDQIALKRVICAMITP
jgi:hypothetical protein